MVNLLDFWRREGLDERDLWANWDAYYRIGLLQFALNNNKITGRHLWLYSILFNLRMQVRRINQVTDGALPETLDAWLTLSDKIYADWLAKRCVPAMTSGFTLYGDIVGKVGDPMTFPRDSAVYRDWRNLAEAMQVIDKRMSDLETERRKMLLETHHLRRKIDHLTRLTFVQGRFVRAFGDMTTPSGDLPGNVSFPAQRKG